MTNAPKNTYNIVQWKTLQIWGREGSYYISFKGLLFRAPKMN